MSLKVSVCLTTYNRAAQLDRTLESLAAQERLPDELIVSDDCSTDGTREAVARWKDRFPLLRYHRNARNLNMPGNLNAAVGLAQGEYIANLHDADTFHPTLLGKWEKALDSHPTAGFVFCGIRGWPNAGESEDGVILHDVAPLTTGRQFFETRLLHRLSSIVWGTVMARRSAYASLLPFDAAFGFVSDVDMWMRMCLGHDVAYVREPLIILDHSPSAERKLDSFNWRWLDNARRMQVANIRRFFEGEPDRLRREMASHRRIARREYARRLLGRLWHGDWTGLRRGIGLSRGFLWSVR